MKKENIILIKSEDFSVRIINLYKHLAFSKKEIVLSKQILRSGTSIGANIAESQNAASKKDFISKLDISMKECGETAYWLRLLRRTDFITNKEYNSLIKDCDEISFLLTSILRTSKSVIKK